MGYDIYIGNTEMEPVEQYDDDEVTVTPYRRVIDGKTVYYKPRVNETQQADAPTFPNDEMTGNGNARHPGYITWSNFCETTGLSELFFDNETGLMREHPGHQPLKVEHAHEISQALTRWKEKHPDTTPGFEKFSFDQDAPIVGYDYTLARLIWLDWWVKWSLAHCEHPAIYNF